MMAPAFGIFAIVWLFFALIGLALMALWIWSIVYIATNEAPEGNTKLIWVLIVVLTNWIGALIYLIIRRPQRIQELGH